MDALILLQHYIPAKKIFIYSKFQRKHIVKKLINRQYYIFNLIFTVNNIH